MDATPTFQNTQFFPRHWTSPEDEQQAMWREPWVPGIQWIHHVYLKKLKKGGLDRAGVGFNSTGEVSCKLFKMMLIHADTTDHRKRGINIHSPMEKTVLPISRDVFWSFTFMSDYWRTGLADRIMRKSSMVESVKRWRTQLQDLFKHGPAWKYSIYFDLVWGPLSAITTRGGGLGLPCKEILRWSKVGLWWWHRNYVIWKIIWYYMIFYGIIGILYRYFI